MNKLHTTCINRAVSRLGLLLCTLLTFLTSEAQEGVRRVAVDSGWASNSVNTVIFRRNALVSYRDTQVIAFYNGQQEVVVGKRRLGSKEWVLQNTGFKGNAKDAHNSISIMVDGAGYLHLAWDHHNHPLRYSRSLEPLSLRFSEKKSMTGSFEKKVSYPEFYALNGGNLLFLYRDGGSGKGNLVVNRYHLQTDSWQQLHSSLLDGEGKRNAYWQAFVDKRGTIHLSWTWRESPDVASNHDICYARSFDGGATWQRSTGEQYSTPITASSAETIVRIPQGSELINQTSMTADPSGSPIIATYWKDSSSSVPQYRIVYCDQKEWKVQNLDFRKTPFSLSGTGTRQIPIARPQLVSWKRGKKTAMALIFRDEERGSRASLLYLPDIRKKTWTIRDLTGESLGSWEPNLDTELWKNKQQLHLFLQYNEQVTGEGISSLAPQLIQVLETDLQQTKRSK